jgi:hypothetical protein
VCYFLGIILNFLIISINWIKTPWFTLALKFWDTKKKFNSIKWQINYEFPSKPQLFEWIMCIVMPWKQGITWQNDRIRLVWKEFMKCSFPCNSPSCRGPTHKVVMHSYHLIMLQGIIISHDLVWLNMPQSAKLLGSGNPLSCCFYESISSGAQYATLQKYFSHPSFSYLLFSNHTHTNKTRTEKKWETTNSKPPPPNIMIGQSETGTSS